MRTFLTRFVSIGVVAAAAAVLLSGCQLPDPSSTTGTGADTGTGNGTPFTDPWKADLYREMTRPLPYGGGDIDGPCGAWEAATPQDAKEMAATHRDCLKNPAKYGMR